MLTAKLSAFPYGTPELKTFLEYLTSSPIAGCILSRTSVLSYLGVIEAFQPVKGHVTNKCRDIMSKV